MTKNILVVDDAAFMRLMLKDILTQNGFSVVAEAANGADAVDLYKKIKVNLVTMDITMPDMDGITAIKKIREFDPDARIIVCSAMGQQAMVLEAIQSGAKDFIVKPFDAERVIDAVEQLAPNGFDDVERVLSYAKREAIVKSYAGTAGFSQEQFARRA